MGDTDHGCGGPTWYTATKVATAERRALTQRSAFAERSLRRTVMPHRGSELSDGVV